MHAPETERTRDLIESQLVAKMLSKLGLFAKAKPSAYSMRDDNDGSSYVSTRRDLSIPRAHIFESTG